MIKLITDLLKSIILSFCLLQSHLVIAQTSKKNYDIDELALPSEVGQLGKKTGSVYYSTTSDNKVLIPVHFWGEVKTNGLHYVPAETTFAKGLSFAGGPASSGKLQEVMLLRRENNKLKKYSFDLTDTDSLKIHDFKLMPGDTVYIPKDYFREDRAYYTTWIAIIVTILSGVILYRQVKRDPQPQTSG